MKSNVLKCCLLKCVIHIGHHSVINRVDSKVKNGFVYAFNAQNDDELSWFIIPFKTKSVSSTEEMLQGNVLQFEKNIGKVLLRTNSDWHNTRGWL